MKTCQQKPSRKRSYRTYTNESSKFDKSGKRSLYTATNKKTACTYPPKKKTKLKNVTSSMIVYGSNKNGGIHYKSNKTSEKSLVITHYVDNNDCSNKVKTERLYTAKEVCGLLNKQEKRLRQEYSNMLKIKLREQFNQFTEFNKEYIENDNNIDKKNKNFSYIC